MSARGLARLAARGLIANEAVFNRWCAGSLCVFLYHDVSDAPSEFSRRYGLNTPPELFARQIGWIRERFHLLTPDEMLSGGYPRPAALITFDDGFPGYFENAVRILADAGAPSLIFLNSDAVCGEPFWAGLVTYLCDEDPAFLERIRPRLTADGGAPFLQARPAWVEDYLRTADRKAVLAKALEFYGPFSRPEHLARAEKNPLVYLGNHLANHYNAASLEERELKDAYSRNLERLRAYSNFREVFSYPFGHPGLCYNARTNRIIFALGAKKVFSAFPSPNFDPGAPILHRVSLDDDARTEKDLLLRVLLPVLKDRLGLRPSPPGAGR